VSVYVDGMRAPVGRMTMCHMVADSTEELIAMADRIGVDRRHLQDRGTYREHFDISLSRRRLAVIKGAKEVTIRELAAILARKRQQLGEQQCSA
jgi:hypothetical protein